MFMQSLLGGKFQRYFEDLLTLTPLWLFVHIPKTAGSSLNAELVPILFPSFHIFVDYSQADTRPFDERLDESVENFIAAAETKRFSYATGHIHARHVNRIVSTLPEVLPITLLRDPVARFVSDYRYQCSAMHPGNEQFRERHPTIDSYMELPEERNKASLALLPEALRDEGDPAACVKHLLTTYGVIGIQEHYALSLRLLTTLAGDPRRPKVFKRVNTPDEASRVTLSPAQEARIRADNALDVAIYEDIASRFRAISGELEAYLDIVDPLPPLTT
jgi:hypothetical protein